MSTVKDLHALAMEHAEQAFAARLRGRAETAAELFAKALRCEVAAIDALHEYSEPTYSILHRSAATLALDCNEVRTAERLAAQALAKTPPEETAQELRDLLERIHFSRHLELRGVHLSDDEMQMNLTGPGVGRGLVNSSAFLARVGDSSRLLHRIVERKKGKPFRERGRSGRDIEENYELFLSTPRAASFSVTLKLGSPVGQQSFPEVRDVPGVLDEFMDLLALANESRIAEIRERIPEPAYFRNFMGIARKMAPDGDRIRQVGFTTVRDGVERRIGVTRLGGEFPPVPQSEPTEFETKSVIIRGVLRYADATRAGTNEIKLIDGDGCPHLVRVPEGMMDDIVRPMWGSIVEIGGRKGKAHIVLDDIKEHREGDQAFERGSTEEGHKPDVTA